MRLEDFTEAATGYVTKPVCLRRIRVGRASPIGRDARARFTVTVPDQEVLSRKLAVVEASLFDLLDFKLYIPVVLQVGQHFNVEVFDHRGEAVFNFEGELHEHQERIK